jgi:predicted ArsR family transcriptional regulator
MLADQTISPDEAVLDLLRERDSMSVADLTQELAVTGTAVRQRLSRLMAKGYVVRNSDRSASGRGRPSHRYRLTPEGRRRAGTNLPEFAVAAWEEIREIEDPEIRRKLLTRIAKRLVRRLAEHVQGDTLDEKVEALVHFFEQRRIPYRVEMQGELPVLTTLSCPYPELADEQRTICTLERSMFEELLGGEIRQHACRLDGGNRCSFELTPAAVN